MNNIDLKTIIAHEVMPGFRGKFLHSQNVTLAYWDIEEGAQLPLHSHIHEQTVNLLEGCFELTIDGETRQIKAGSVVIIPPNVKHSGAAITYCRILDIFYPIRKDYQTLSQSQEDI